MGRFTRGGTTLPTPAASLEIDAHGLDRAETRKPDGPPPWGGGEAAGPHGGVWTRYRAVIPWLLTVVAIVVVVTITLVAVLLGD
jgi:hypothetical protein